MIPNDLDNMFSLGTTPTINTLLHILNEYKNPPDTVVVNVDTLVRNCSSIEEVNQYRKFERENQLQPAKSMRRLLDLSQREVQAVLTEIIGMYQELNISNPTIILYLGSYKQFIPPVQQRRTTDSKIIAQLVSKQLENSVTAKMVQKSGKVSVIQLPKAEMKLPYKSLIDEIYGLQNNHVVALISHHPLDYHLYKYCNEFYLLNSFTGKVSTQAELPKKVFEVNAIPFNPMTHALLGDKEDILPFMKPNERKKLIDIATKESWISMLEDDIAKRFNDLGLRIPFKI